MASDASFAVSPARSTLLLQLAQIEMLATSAAQRDAQDLMDALATTLS
jgi:hypothetical protein